tara:strand:+ start:1102 stop:2109 length:1008 start_codon:yes stop_codon:yes gene_type:complete
MATLTNEQIDLTYAGLIKTADNTALDLTIQKSLTDGLGNNLPMTAAQDGISFNGGVDFAGATITGLSAGGLVAGTGSNSIKSADFLTSGAPTASANNTICLGNGGIADGSNAIYIGAGGQAGQNCIGIGEGAVTVSGPAIAIGRNARAIGSVALAMGNSATVESPQSIGLSGENISINSAAQRSVGIGRQVSIQSNNCIAIGNYARVLNSASNSMNFATSGVGVGAVSSVNSVNIAPGNYNTNITAAAPRAIGIGSANQAMDKVTAPDGIAIGTESTATAAGAVSLGREIVANMVDTVSVREIEVQTVGGGITMYSPDGTAYKLTVANGGTLVIT